MHILILYKNPNRDLGPMKYTISERWPKTKIEIEIIVSWARAGGSCGGTQDDGTWEQTGDDIYILLFHQLPR